MKYLHSLQHDFFSSFKGEASFENHILVKGTNPRNRLTVYHHTIREKLMDALEISYPLTWKLIGEDCARAAAFAFIKTDKLPTIGNLCEWGDEFPDFLETYEHTQSLAYLPDFVRLEWLMYRAYAAEDATPRKGEDFANLTPEQYEKLSLKLHPSAYLFKSPHSLEQVMDVLEDKVDHITLDNKPSFALVLRPHLKVNVHWLKEADFTLLGLIQNGHPLLDALETLNTPEFSFNDFLSFCLKNGVFSEYKINM
jgi:hypothetical protein